MFNEKIKIMVHFERELRIGNIIAGTYSNDEDDELTAQCRVVAVDENRELGDGWSIMVDSKEGIEYFSDFGGIKISAKRLEEFGFHTVKNRWYVLGAIKLEKCDDYFRVTIAGHFVCNLEHIHQLQNFYFVISGKELDVNFKKKNAI